MAIFGNRQFNEGTKLVNHSCLECQDIEEAFARTHWMDWQSRDIDELREQVAKGCLISFSDEAFRFFLPAFLVANLDCGLFDREIARALTDPRKLRARLGRDVEFLQDESLISNEVKLISERAANEPVGPSELERFDARMKGFTKDELGAIEDFLHFLKTHRSEKSRQAMIEVALLTVRRYLEK
ncbi:MAG: hypothetical protein HY078_12205 [Elusimicrobia bacterium]|nr:hypothetical protein [Elusimicrobiota bacterium]